MTILWSVKLSIRRCYISIRILLDAGARKCSSMFLYISMRQAKVTVWNRRRSITTFPYEMAARKILVNISLSDRLNTEFPGDVLLSATTIQ